MFLKIEKNSPTCQTNSRQRFRISRVNVWPTQVTMQPIFVTSNEYTKISIFNLKMEF